MFFVGALHVSVLIFAEDLGDVLPVSEETGQKLSGLFFHSFLGSCKFGEVVVEGGVVTEGEVVRGKVCLQQGRVVRRHFHDVQEVEPVSVLVLGDSEKLLDGAVHSLGLPVGLGVEST